MRHRIGPPEALTHPVVALGLFAGSPFLLYFTPVFGALARFHRGRMLINMWFAAVGYLFFWVVIGADPAPRLLPGIGNGPASSDMHQALALPSVPSLAVDLVALVVLLLRWRREDGTDSPGYERLAREFRATPVGSG